MSVLSLFFWPGVIQHVYLKTGILSFMKRFSVLLFVLVSFSVVAASQDYRKIDLTQKDIETRSIVSLPEAYIEGEVLHVSFDASGIYSLCVENCFGETVYSSTMPANGMEYSYDLSAIGGGTFRLVLTGQSGRYEGIFSM